jgi:hypothetical protein
VTCAFPPSLPPFLPLPSLGCRNLSRQEQARLLLLLRLVAGPMKRGREAGREAGREGGRGERVSVNNTFDFRLDRPSIVTRASESNEGREGGREGRREGGKVRHLPWVGAPC